MKKRLLLVNLMLVSSISFSQNVPIDFEIGGYGADWTWTVFEQNTESPPPLEIVDNPFKSGINTSDKVAKFTALQSGNRWAGVECDQGTNLGNFTLNSTNNIIKIMVYKTVISPVGIKLAAWGGGWSKGELKVSNTKINEWEQLSFDFSVASHNENPPFNENNGMFNQIIIYPDFPDNAREQDNIVFFDYVWGEGEHLGSNVSLDEKYSKPKILVQPNPTNGIFTVNSEFPIENVEIYNTKGQLISTLISNNQEVIIDLMGVELGVYLLKVCSNGITSNEKIIMN
jgi:hypothetical protein